ncbi:MAG: hypothetical protein IPP90_09395 [Gemmatimonadaceae bacterium]|nr:hypothetical protein [Gemmatimonadaceae bacterium]
MTKGRESKSGVFIAEDFRDNLIIDRYDPVFASMRASKRKHLRSVNSEDAVTWNVFRSLRQIAPTIWLPDLFATAFPGAMLSHAEHATVALWKTVEPPPALLVDADEGESEIDVVIETPSMVWFIEAKLHGDISTRTTTRADRDQVLRNIDVGSYYAGVRRFHFSLLVADRRRSEEGVKAVESYRDVTKVRHALGKHRSDGLENLGGVGLLLWSDLAEVLAGTIDSTSQEDERLYASRALAWLRGMGL